MYLAKNEEIYGIVPYQTSRYSNIYKPDANILPCITISYGVKIQY